VRAIIGGQRHISGFWGQKPGRNALVAPLLQAEARGLYAPGEIQMPPRADPVPRKESGRSEPSFSLDVPEIIVAVREFDFLQIEMFVTAWLRREQ